MNPPLHDLSHEIARAAPTEPAPVVERDTFVHIGVAVARVLADIMKRREGK